MDQPRWYFKPHVLIATLLSLTAMSMVLLTLVLLPRTSEMLGVMQWRMVNAKTFRVTTDIDYSGWRNQTDGSPERDREELAMSTEGVVDRTNRIASRQQHRFEVVVGADSSTAGRFKGDWRHLGDSDFLRFDAVPQSFGTLRFDRFTSRWLRADFNRLLDQVDIPIFGSGRKLSEADHLYLIEQFRMTPFLTVQQRLKNETVGGIETYHYEVRPETLFIKDFFVTSETLRRGRELTADERREVDRFFANLVAENGEIWIGRSDYYLYRMRLRFKYDDGVRDGVLSLTVSFSDFNQPVSVAGPDGEIQNVSDIVKSLLPGIVSRLPLSKLGGQNVAGTEEDGPSGGLPIDEQVGKDADPDADGLTNPMELFYNSDPNDPDSDGDGMNDGDEVDAGRNPTGRGKLFDFGMEEALGGAEVRRGGGAEDGFDVGTVSETP